MGVRWPESFQPFSLSDLDLNRSERAHWSGLSQPEVLTAPFVSKRQPHSLQVIQNKGLMPQSLTFADQ